MHTHFPARFSCYVPLFLWQGSKGSKAAGSKGGGKRPNASAASTFSRGGGGVGGGVSASSVLAETHRLRNDEIERTRTDPLTDLHLWTFWRKNPLADGGALPVDEPEWPGPLKEVRVGVGGGGGGCTRYSCMAVVLSGHIV